MRQYETSEISRALLEVIWHFGPRGLNGQCCADLSMPEYMALEKVANTPNCPVQEIGTVLGFTKSGATRVVNRLEKKGYIVKKKSSEDGRICCLVLTPGGEAMIRSVAAHYDEKVGRLLARLPERTGHGIKEAMSALAGALQG